LYSICTATQWRPTFEMNRHNKQKVDLGLVYSQPPQKQKKYIIELATNCRNQGESHSAEGHYSRQVDKYSGNDITGSIVIIIYSYKQPNGYHWWPKNPKIQYLIVEHLLENPTRVFRGAFGWLSTYINERSCQHLTMTRRIHAQLLTALLSIPPQQHYR